MKALGRLSVNWNVPNDHGTSLRGSITSLRGSITTINSELNSEVNSLAPSMVASPMGTRQATPKHSIDLSSASSSHPYLTPGRNGGGDDSGHDNNYDHGNGNDHDNHDQHRSSSLSSSSPHDHLIITTTGKSRRRRDGTKLINDYTILQDLGKGTNAEVKLVQHCRTNQLFACKIVMRPNPTSRNKVYILSRILLLTV